MYDNTPLSQVATSDGIIVCRSARLQPAAYRFYRAILLTFVAKGHAPDPSSLDQMAVAFGVPSEATLADLAAQDLVQRDPLTGRIQAAYPFSGVPTPHRVALLTDRRGERIDHVAVEVFAMCALDALGIPLMLRRSALIISAEALTGEPIRVLVSPATPQRDLLLATELTDWRAHWDPPGAVVYARPPEHEGTRDAGRCVAAITRCPVTNFFSVPDHVDTWIAGQTAGLLDGLDGLDGLVLGQAEALARAHERFAGILDRLLPESVQAYDPGDSDQHSSRQIELSATIRCPQCGEQYSAQMPTDACLIRSTCPFCGAVLAPLPGDCCVFCSYGDRPCPSEQERQELPMATSDPQEIASATAADVLQRTDPELIRSMFQLLRLLLDGAPVSAERFASSTGITREEAETIFAGLRAWGAEFDEAGAFVGAGLTLIPTSHRYEVNGRDFYTWCAPDTVLFPLMFGHTAVIDSPDPISGERVRFTVSPMGVEAFEPATAVLSSRRGGDAANVRGSMCQYGHFFASRETAAEYIARHEGVPLAILTPDETFQLTQALSQQEPFRSIKETLKEA